MVKLRLSRTGPRRKPFYRIVAIDERLKMGGQPLEVLGYWMPAKNEKKIDKAKINKWLAIGAKISPGLDALLK